MPVIEVTGVGALVRPVGDTQYRPKGHGDLVEVTDEDARRLVGDGVAVLVEDPVAENAEEEEPQGGAIDLDTLTVPELRKFANDRRPTIALAGARTRSEILERIRAAMEGNPEAGAQLGASMVAPVPEMPLAHPEAAEPGGPASPHPAPEEEA